MLAMIDGSQTYNLCRVDHRHHHSTCMQCGARGPKGTQPGVLKFRVQPVSTLAFAPSATRLASGGRDGAMVACSLQRNGRRGPIGAEDLGASVGGLYRGLDWDGLAALGAGGGVTDWRIGPTKDRIARPLAGLPNGAGFG